MEVGAASLVGIQAEELMAYGIANHLWIHGSPDRARVRQWMDAALGTSFGENPRSDIVVADVFQFGLALTLIDVQVLGAPRVVEGEAGAGAAEEKDAFLTRVAILAKEAGFKNTRVWMSDVGTIAWELEFQGDEGVPMGAKREDEALRTLWPDGWSVDPLAPVFAREVIRSIVKLPLEEVHHYIDWAVSCRSAMAAGTPVEGFNLTRATRLLATHYLVWKGKVLPKPTPVSEMAPKLGRARRMRRAATLVPAARVWGLVLLVAFVVPAVLYRFIFAPPVESPVKGFVLSGVMTLVWALFALARFDDFQGRPVRLPWRVALFVGGQLAVGVLMWWLHGMPR
ncbi:hypothetical protein A176_001822 [Myxococcus hansupus]|uniref:Uncharacterized protein n=1 Tax=Pseudomyxococcus hansupus TaxID=1297742 RepID=A0A0H4WUC4_9BACT|nr:hypothetical protein A176_001822 [Myxococcus hansupus]